MAVATGLLRAPLHEATLEVHAPPDEVWGMVADISRMGEYSPVCRQNEWLGELSEPVVGARFRGHNRNGLFRWSRECVVTEAEPGRVFAFSTIFKGAESTRWRYSFAATSAGRTLITESYQVVRVPRWIRALWLLPGAKVKAERDHKRNMAGTLEHIKAAAEGARP